MADANKPKGERTYLDVPFKEKQSARELGAKFDRREKKWYVPAGSDPSLFARWMPSGPKERPLSEGQSDDFESDIEREAQRLRDRFKKTARGAVNLFGKLLTLVI